MDEFLNKKFKFVEADEHFNDYLIGIGNNFQECRLKQFKLLSENYFQAWTSSIENLRYPFQPEKNSWSLVTTSTRWTQLFLSWRIGKDLFLVRSVERILFIGLWLIQWRDRWRNRANNDRWQKSEKYFYNRRQQTDWEANRTKQRSHSDQGILWTGSFGNNDYWKHHN